MVRELGLITEGNDWLEGTLVIIYFSPTCFPEKKQTHGETRDFDDHVCCHRNYSKGQRGLHHSASVKKEPETGVWMQAERDLSSEMSSF